MSSEPWINTPHDLASKMENEGGLIAALDYGIKPEDFTDAPEVADLKRLWGELVAAYEPVEVIAGQIEEITENLDWSEDE
jgi:hypothetical protein